MSLLPAPDRSHASVRRHPVNRIDDGDVAKFMSDVLSVNCSPVLGKLLVTTTFQVTTG